MSEPNANWRTLAACRGTDPDTFFPDIYGLAEVAEAKAICASCPVRLECLHLALSVPKLDDTDGVFGGTTPAERKAIRRRARRAARRAAA